jgi:hypothetical protein
MRAIRDFILVTCAVLTTTCVVYMVYNVEVLRVALGDTSAPWGPFLKQSMASPEELILQRFKKSGQEPASANDAYGNSARDSLKKLIEKPASR